MIIHKEKQTEQKTINKLLTLIPIRNLFIINGFIKKSADNKQKREEKFRTTQPICKVKRFTKRSY